MNNEYTSEDKPVTVNRTMNLFCLPEHVLFLSLAGHVACSENTVPNDTLIGEALRKVKVRGGLE